MENKFDVFTDCIYFPLDRPCVYQKNDAMRCAECKKYIKISAADKNTRILIIKLGAMGDVLRTTFLLEGLKELYPESFISWIVNANNAGVLQNNPLINEIIFNDANTSDYLVNHYFDVVINLDLAKESLALAKLTNVKQLIGYTLNQNREILTSNEYAAKWLKLSAYDELKKANKLTYQHWMSKIVGLKKDNYEIIVPLSDLSKEKAAAFLKANNISSDKKIIGINPGAGKRWKLKKWRTQGFIEVARYFSSKGYVILLLGGKDDTDDIKLILKENIANVYSAGVDNSVPDFFAFINLCDIILCGDTMALHAAAGLKKKIVALFGPTSLPEIEIYARGEKIQSNKECIGCYRQECDIADNCMELISTKEVIEAIARHA